MKFNIEGITEQSGIYIGKKNTTPSQNQHPPQRRRHRQKNRKRKEPDHHRYLDMGKHRQQSRVQSKSKRNHRIHQCRIQTQPLRTGLCTDRTREREIRKHHLGRNLKENNRMKSMLQMCINK